MCKNDVKYRLCLFVGETILPKNSVDGYMRADIESAPTTKRCSFCFYLPKSRKMFVIMGLAKNRLLVSASDLVDKTQARTTLLRGIIPGRSLTEENVGDCAVVLPPKSNKMF